MILEHSQPTTLTQPGPRVVANDYDAAGRLTTTTFPGGVIGRTYDSAGRLATLSGMIRADDPDRG